jgi:hypothetical protein
MQNLATTKATHTRKVAHQKKTSYKEVITNVNSCQQDVDDFQNAHKRRVMHTTQSYTINNLQLHNAHVHITKPRLKSKMKKIET